MREKNLLKVFVIYAAKLLGKLNCHTFCIYYCKRIYWKKRFMQKIFFYNFAVVSNYTSNVFMKAERIGGVTVVINALVKKELLQNT